MLERRPAGAVQVAIPAGQVALEQGRDVVPAAPLVLGHASKGSREEAVGPGVVAPDLPHQSTQRRAPPRHGAALLGYARRELGLTVLQRVAHPLTHNPLVAREGCGGVFERREESGACLTDPRRLGRRAVVISAALIPVAKAPDNFVAPAVRA